ncbi:hypothetical protein MHYP_G00251240 [Metynnis hypsauchen]
MMHHQPALPIYTVFFMSVIVFIPCCVSGRIFYTYLRTRCLEDCRLYGSEYKCNTITEEGVIDTLYCSPENNLDHKGNECTSPCWKEIKDYYWCKTGWTWGYCGHVKEDQNYYTKYGEMCSDTCGMHGKSYYWCKTNQSWDYCSIKMNMDYKGNACHQDHPCGKHNEPYYWCKRAEGGWGYCGPVEPNTLHKYFFLDDVLPDNSEPFICSYNASVWNNLRHFAFEKVGSQLDLCKDNGEVKQNRHCKRLGEDEEIVDLKIDQDKCIATVFRVCPGCDTVTDGSSWSNDITSLIAQWKHEYLGKHNRSQLITSHSLRIALQRVLHIGQLYHNLQIQLYVPNRPEHSTTVSQILIPKNPPIPIPDSYVRRAFSLSFSYLEGVIMDINSYHTRLG